jgi:hypothetical protein
MPTIRGAPETQTGLNLVIVSVFLLAAAYEFWRGRDERLTARWPLIVLLVLHGGFSAIGAIEALSGGAIDSFGAGSMQGWMAFVHFETLAFVIGTSIFVVAMTRERSELVHKIAASIDALTGVATRRVFYDQGETMLAEALRDDASPSRSSCSTSTASRRSTIPTDTDPGDRCCGCLARRR